MKKAILICIGFLSLAIGSIGIILPILPTTPFIIIAAICFASSNEKLYNKLLNTKYFGEFIRNYKQKTGISKPTKIKAIVFVNLMLIISAFIFRSLLVHLVLLAVGIGVTLHILLLKNKK